ncbi:DUF2306 domain-containing protein [Georgenia sp. 10Sc9-8]|uniref:DUF2306 domain-containing protein n=1 Tax=Georgenia halotolerans TaxID=3028317 RepID=A0ABT5U1I1_9MICO|nr:DUF2306 domain-containing protein [Georgenia halotolerans]
MVLLSLVPVLAGAVRITELAAGAEITDANARFFASPAPVLVHIVTASVYSVLGAFQFLPSLRRGGRRWHRLSGRLLAPLGLLAALSGVWMTVFYTHPDGANAGLFALRLFFGLAMAASIVLGVLAVLRRDIRGHSAWMTRAYAIGLGAGTQVFTNLPWLLVLGPPDKTAVAVLMGAGWVINVAVAEYVIRRRRRVGPPRPSSFRPTPVAPSSI